jgi:hypothetical protein
VRRREEQKQQEFGNLRRAIDAEMREGNDELAAYQSWVSNYMAQEVVHVDAMARSEELSRLSALQLEALANADARSDREQRATTMVIPGQAMRNLVLAMRRMPS